MTPDTPAAQAVDALISEYYKLVFHTIYGLTNDWEESQDLTQETFQKALKGIDDARVASGAKFQPKAWLLSIAVNSVRMQRRRRNLFRFIPISVLQKGKPDADEKETESDTLTASAAPLQPAGYGAHESADPAELLAERDTVQRAMARLSEPLRECLLLSVVGDLSNSEIAALLDVQEAAVRQRLTRARKQFQQFYALESSEDVGNASSVSNVGDNNAGRSAKAEKPKRDIHKQQKREEVVKSQRPTDEQQCSLHSDTSSSARSSYTNAKRFNRKSAATPLW